MGTAVKHFSINAKQTVMIVRRRVIRKEKPNNGYDFLVLYDGSEESKKALSESLKIIDPQKDKIDCISFAKGESMESHRASVEKIFEDAKLAHATYKVVPILDDTPQGAIEKYLTNESTPDYDFVVLGTKGSGMKKKTQTEYLGTVAEKVILIGRTNLILVVK